MSDYEFWNELGNIFNAIVAYQHKTIEFNKRFVNPWLNLGTIFDQNDRNADTLLAQKKAIEIDPVNGSNWLSLGDVYFKMGSFEDAAAAYAKAIELNPRLGWAYANLALTNATRQKYTEAVNLYVKSLELIEDEKDRAMIWNRLGNVYRKVNDYENAFIAFQMADECDGQNTGFQDKLDEVTVEQRVMPILAEVYVNQNNGSKVPVENAPVAADQPVQQVETEVTETSVVETVAEPAKEPVIFTGVDDPADEVACVSAEETPIAVSAESVEEASVVKDLIAETKEAILEQDVEPAQEQAAEATAVAKIEEQPAPSLTAEALVEDVPVEIIQPQSLIEAPAEEIAGEIPQPETPAETLITETFEGPQLQAADAVSVSDDSNGSPQAKPADETVKKEIAVEETLPQEEIESMVAVETISDPDQAETPADPAPQEKPETIVAAAVLAEFANTDTSADTTVAFAISETVETFADPSSLNQPVVLVVEDIADLIGHAISMKEVVAETPSEETEASPEVRVEAGESTVEPVMEVESESRSAEAHDDVASIVAEIVALVDANTETTAPEESLQESTTSVEAVISGEQATELLSEPAYEEFLKDAVELAPVDTEKNAMEENVSPVKAELKIEPDAKNAHIWNELGNVYFNTGAFEEAIASYNKAIELDNVFAWPYSNLALVYVQKEKYTEAVLLYQRSIELFTSDKEKAITWNRLGNVYRRLNDYENAIACYQRADELDPNNATRSLRSRFSLLGSVDFEQSPSLSV